MKKAETKFSNPCYNKNSLLLGEGIGALSEGLDIKVFIVNGTTYGVKLKAEKIGFEGNFEFDY